MSADFQPGNQIDLLETGSEYFPALLAAIAAAECEIRLETYIYADDDTGRMVTAALAAAARRGVAVHVLVDGFGAHGFAAGLGRSLTEAGATISVFRPEVSRLQLRRRRLRRLHRKLAVIDARIAFVGGINVINDADSPVDVPRFDYAVRIAGPLVALIHASMRHLWHLVGWSRRQRRPPLPPPVPCAQDSVGSMAAGTMQAAFVVRDNLRHRRDIEEAYLEAIAAARGEILIASAYFLPGLRFRHALREAAQRGVAVTILLQGRVEYTLLHYATQALYRRLLLDGVRIIEYRTSFLHAKVAVIDDDWATIGSSNIDPFSLLMAREANIVVRDAGFAATLRASLQRAMDHGAGEIFHADFARGGLLARALRWLAYGLVRVMLSITRYGGEDYRE